jgi:phage terminase large subunit-like protein
MIDMLQKFSPEEILNSLAEAKEYQKTQDHIHFRMYDGKPFKPNQKQLDYFETGLHARERALIAANRFGKTLSVSMEVCAHLTGIYPDWWNGYRYDRPLNVWVAGVSNKETNQNLKAYYVGDVNKIGWIHPSLILDHKPLENLYLIRHISGGISKLRFKSFEQGREAWQAEKVDIVHPDEEMPYDIYSEALTRTAITAEGDHGMIMPSLTPLKGMTLFLLHFMQREEGDEEVKNVASGEVHNSIVYVSATHDDAPHIPQEEKERLLKSYSPHEREARTKGVPSLGSGLIYPIPESQIVISPIKIEDHWPRCFGMDFGWHNTAAIFIALDQDNDVAYAYGEYLAGHLTPQHHAYHLIKQGADWMPGAYDHAGESATQDDGGNVVELYQQAGIRNWVPADKRSVNKGIYTVLQRMETGKLKIFSTLTKTLTEYRMYARDDNGKVKKGNDHLMDAMRYGVVTGLPIARVKTSTLNKFRIPTHQDSGGGWMRV